MRKPGLCQTITAALLLGLAGCSSSPGPSAQGAATSATSAASTSSTTPDNGGTTSSTAAGTTSSASHPPRPDDACTMLTSDEVAGAVGTSGPYTGAHEDPAADGSLVWGCTWGTHFSYADIRETTAAQFASVPDPSDITTSPVSGIGDKARLDTMNPDGRNPELWFAAGGGYYDVSVVVSRSELGADNAAHEESAERALANLLAKQLSS